MELKNLGLGLVVTALVALVAGAVGGATLSKPIVIDKVVRQVVEQSFGATPGGDFTQQVNLMGGTIQSHFTAASTSNASLTLGAADMAPNGIPYDTVIHEPIVGDVTITFPASSTLVNMVPRVGDKARQCWVNGTTTAGIDITFAAGTGIDFLISSSTTANTAQGASAVLLTALADQSVCFDFTRKYRNRTDKTIPGDIQVAVTRYVDGD